MKTLYPAHLSRRGSNEGKRSIRTERRSPSIRKKLIELLPFLVLLFTFSILTGIASAATYTVSSNTTWSGLSGTPNSSDIIVVQNGARLTVNVSNAVCASIQLGKKNSGTGTLYFNSGSKVTVSGTVTLGETGGTSYGGIVDMTNGGSLLCRAFSVVYASGSTFTAGSGTVEMTTTNTLPTSVFTSFNNLTINGNTTLGTAISLSGNLVINATKTLASNNKNISIAGNWTNNGTFTAGTATVTFTSTSTGKTISGNLTGTSGFNALTFNGSGGSWNLSNNAEVASGLNLTQGTLNVNPGINLKVSGTTSLGNALCLVLESDDTNGTATLLDNGFSGSGTVKVERYIANDYKWHFLSSPVSAQNIWPEFAPNPGSGLNFGSSWNWDFYYWNPNSSLTTAFYWVNLRKNTAGDYNDNAVDQAGSYAGFGTSTPPKFTIGRGYLAAYNTGWTTGSPTIHSFSGTPNTSTVTIPISANDNTFNLVGNPYPSHIDWKASSGWTRGNLTLNGSGYDYWIFNDNAGNYGVFNSSGTTGTNGVSRYIAPEQGFFVKASTTATISMNNAVRISSTQAWLKGGNSETDQIKLRLSGDATSYSDEMIVEINPTSDGGGSDKFWSLYTEAPEIYSVKNGNNYSIDRYTSLDRELNVEINAKIGIAGTYTISIDSPDQMPASKIILEDLKTGINTDLKETQSYSFTGAPDDDRNRFRLVIGSATGIDEAVNSNFNVYAYDKTIQIQNYEGKPYRVNVSNLIGQTVYSGNHSGIGLSRIEHNFVPGIYLVTVLSEGKTSSRKVVIK